MRDDFATARIFGVTKKVSFMLVKGGPLEVRVPADWDHTKEQVSIGGERFYVWPGGSCKTSIVSTVIVGPVRV